MTVRLLGTGAAEGIPAFLSDSRVSLYAREHGGKDVRTRCGALVDRSLKIDLPPDTLAQMHRDKLDARDWTCLLFTHSHADHFAIEEIQYGLHPFSGLEHLCFTIYGNPSICEKLYAKYPDWPIDVVAIHSFHTFSHGPFTITPIRATHMVEEDCQNHIIEREGRRLLYGADTGIWDEQTWEFLGSQRLDALVIECTEGTKGQDWWGHLGTDEVVRVVDRLRASGVLPETAPVVTTHHSHNGGATHAELEAALNPHGIRVGFDGIEFEV